MKQIVVFAGTTEGRLISAWLAGEGLLVLACVATEYGSLMVKEQEGLSVHQGRLSGEEMRALFEEEGLPLVVDATHPYATEVSLNICRACEEAGCEYLRLIRPENTEEAGGDCITVGSVEEAVAYLAGTEGPVLVTTGSKELHHFTALADYQERIYARVLATPEVVEHCQSLGIRGQHLICMQGPFSREMNTAMLRQFGALWLVTKESGREGGFSEKLAAAREAKARVLLIRRPPEQEGLFVEEGIALLRRRFSLESYPENRADEPMDPAKSEKRRAVLAGIGMGPKEGMTEEVWTAFEEADCILGAGRMLESLGVLGKPMLDTYDPARMLSYLQEHPEYKRIAVALSGDVGFYSGAKRLIRVFEEAGIETELLPGISSAAYLCSRLKIAWEDVKLMSVHGRRGNLLAAVRGNFRTFTLLGGKDSVSALCEELLSYDMEHVTVYVGERLRYPGERIAKGSPGELKGRTFDGLCAALIENPAYQGGIPSCMEDEAFVRGRAPMTKSEIRCLSVAKLGLCRDSSVYDIGAGTGSVTVEMALQAFEGTVWAIERDPEAVELIRENARKFQTSNVEIREGTAPEALADLPMPTHAFIGGSSSNLREILELLLKKNPGIRVVINAVTLETVGEAVQCLKELPFSCVETVEVQIARARSLGAYQLMTGQNPVYIFTAQGGVKG